MPPTIRAEVHTAEGVLCTVNGTCGQAVPTVCVPQPQQPIIAGAGQHCAVIAVVHAWVGGGGRVGWGGGVVGKKGDGRRKE
jgi:hypothetical protein